MGGAVYGLPPPELAEAPAGATQVSPFCLGAAEIEALADGSIPAFVVAAPAGTLERRYVLAHALRALVPGGELLALAPKDRGGGRLRRELDALGCAVIETARRHHRICRTHRPADIAPLFAAIAEGSPRLVPGLGLWSQPGVFSWDRLDPGAGMLLNHLEGLAGDGADLGCGIGVLARRLVESPKLTAITLIDLDRRALAAARRNVCDPRARFLQADARSALPLDSLDFVVTNPPFHGEGREDRSLGQAFIATAAAMLRRGGLCRLVANRALPYEAALAARFRSMRRLADEGGYKVLEAVR